MNKYPVYEGGKARCPNDGFPLERLSSGRFRCDSCKSTFPPPPEVIMAESGAPRLIQ